MQFSWYLSSQIRWWWYNASFPQLQSFDLFVKLRDIICHGVCRLAKNHVQWNWSITMVIYQVFCQVITMMTDQLLNGMIIQVPTPKTYVHHLLSGMIILTNQDYTGSSSHLIGLIIWGNHSELWNSWRRDHKLLAVGWERFGARDNHSVLTKW